MDEVFHRHEYAREMAEDLLRPSPLTAGTRSGVFFSGIRRVGKTTFLRQDLIPALEAQGALTIYVDLWAELGKSPSALVHDQVRRTLGELQEPGSRLLGVLKRMSGAEFEAAGFKFGFQLEALGGKDGVPLADVFVELIWEAKTDVVLIVDEVQQAMTSEDGLQLLHALKAARDRVNTDPAMPGHFIFLGTGSHKALVTDMANRRTQPFAGAMTASFRVLDEDFVRWQLARVKRDARVVVPSVKVAVEGFRVMGNRPEELTKALLQLQQACGAGVAPDDAFPIICSTLANAAADVELKAIEDFGELGKAIFSRIASGQTSGLFSAEALGSYSAQTGTTVEVGQVQQTADKMIAANLIKRQRHGIYAVADPFVGEVWTLRQEQLLRLLGDGGGDDGSDEDEDPPGPSSSERPR